MADTLPEHPPRVPIPMSEERIWIDGCFDFTHHGHAGAMLQAKLLGSYLVVGVHSDEEILENKGPTVMSLRERMASVSACKWANLAVPGAPYVTDPAWMDQYGCQYVVHGDDVTTDSSGEDCYRIVKSAGRFRIVARTPGISTTDLVGRMLLCTKTHHLRNLGASLYAVLTSVEAAASNPEARAHVERIRAYASDAMGEIGAGAPVFYYDPVGACRLLVDGRRPGTNHTLVYVDGGFDLFTPGHVEFLRLAVEDARARGETPYVVAGVHNDATINRWKGLNYPIMNLFERALCVLQCRFVDAVVLEAPFIPDAGFLGAVGAVLTPGGAGGDGRKTGGTVGKTGGGGIRGVYHGPTAFMPGEEDTYSEARTAGIFREVGKHEWAAVNAGEIVKRILRERERYEERQRKKGVKAVREDGMAN